MALATEELSFVLLVFFHRVFFIIFGWYGGRCILQYTSPCLKLSFVCININCYTTELWLDILHFFSQCNVLNWGHINFFDIFSHWYLWFSIIRNLIIWINLFTLCFLESVIFTSSASALTFDRVVFFFDSISKISFDKLSLLVGLVITVFLGGILTAFIDDDLISALFFDLFSSNMSLTN